MNLSSFVTLNLTFGEDSRILGSWVLLWLVSALVMRVCYLHSLIGQRAETESLSLLARSSDWLWENKCECVSIFVSTAWDWETQKSAENVESRKGQFQLIFMEDVLIQGTEIISLQWYVEWRECFLREKERYFPWSFRLLINQWSYQLQYFLSFSFRCKEIKSDTSKDCVSSFIFRTLHISMWPTWAYYCVKKANSIQIS